MEQNFTKTNKFRIYNRVFIGCNRISKKLWENDMFWIQNWKLSYFPINKTLPDLICDLEINLTIDDVRLIFKLQEDSHIMIETINDENSYTGERYFEYDFG